MARILYIEDEQEIGRWVTMNLTELGHHVIWLRSGEEAEEHLAHCDLVILDVMLPGLDGFSIGKRIKKEQPDLPILMLSARTAIEDKVEGLSFADDYLTKPFHPDELAARVEVLLRRFNKNDEILKLKHLTIHTKDMRIVNHETGEEILLTGKQYQIFQYFLRHLNQILTKEQLYEGVWGEPYMEGDKTLMVHIRYLREKLEKDPKNPEIIETIRGIGYRVRK
ncbi:response regulator transcription factor [Parageobacillus thermoglucosidasius]|uniref:response regulator transcription factor n=1 Tax=Parageobacillus thermoglucosidasius TaxID=1426 RepID=UPI000E177584|nr:response regulator transcription factor [Parageobacillus thermoglucosidasius]MED4904006.1 response regulator transcription factor [Parageobacillus thermoglucosidasius]MED4914965.1 response regulator transcription factor [Parageobacillus thermoglucosidasius]MED4943785.1 response regulator transcription factor [Parageobacillus thermoglucosidasius]MED4984207.1 response regulator transcription factor [Parageobacillus thermoglucosidasius]RDE18670.1 DNA-binding response regulator [Parageobacillus